MSKSLGNVLDPFEVMDQFGTDALRYYCFREVSFGHDGGVSTTTFGERYESELANDYGNLASRTLAMIGRYRDGVVPDVEVDPALAARLRRPRRGGLRAARPRRDHAGARAHLAARAAAQPLRRGAGARGSSPRTRRSAADLDATLRSLAEGIRAVTVLLHPYMPETAAKLLAALGEEDLALESAALRRAGRGGGTSASCRRCSRSRSDRQPHPSRLDARRPTRRSSPPPARPASRRILTIGTDAESCRRAQAAAEAHDEVWFAVGHHPNSATGYTDAITDELRELARHPRCVAIGETGPRRLPRLRAARRPGARVRRPHRPRARAGQAARDPHARGRRRHDRHARPRRGGPRGDPALLLDARPPGGVPRARLVDLVRRQRDLPERRASSRSPPSRRRSTACSSRPTRPTSRPQAVRKQRNQPAFVVHTARFVAERRGIGYDELEAAVHANSARLFGW